MEEIVLESSFVDYTVLFDKLVHIDFLLQAILVCILLYLSVKTCYLVSGFAYYILKQFMWW